jgi:hypothetical protein
MEATLLSQNLGGTQAGHWQSYGTLAKLKKITH